jgi:ATP-dependent Lon protease
LFDFGTVAKVSGVEGRGTGEFALLVEGICRFKVEKIMQERPFFEAQVLHFHDDGECKSVGSTDIY